jgi:hypothetical protein
MQKFFENSVSLNNCRNSGTILYNILIDKIFFLLCLPFGNLCHKIFTSGFSFRISAKNFPYRFQEIFLIVLPFSYRLLLILLYRKFARVLSNYKNCYFRFKKFSKLIILYRLYEYLN